MSLPTLTSVVQVLADRCSTVHTALIEGSAAAVWTRRPFTLAKLEQHLAPGSNVRYGLCPIKPGEHTTRVAVLDFDSHGGDTPWAAMVDIAGKVQLDAELDGINFQAFRSSGGKGIHLIAVWAAPQDAYSVRHALSTLLARHGLKNGAKGGVAAGRVEIFPKQDSVPANGFGNMFVLPLARESRLLDMANGGQPIGRDATVSVLVWRDSAPVKFVEKPVPVQRSELSMDAQQVKSMLDAIPNDEKDYDLYLQIVMGVADHFQGSDEGFHVLQSWTSRNPCWNNAEDEKQWAWASRGGLKENRVTLATVRMFAARVGWYEAPTDADFELLDADGNTIDPDDLPEPEPLPAKRAHWLPTVVTPSEPGSLTALAGPDSEQIDPGNLPSVRPDKNGRIDAESPTLHAFVKHGDATEMLFGTDAFRDLQMVNENGSGWRPLQDTDYTELKLRLMKRVGFKEIETNRMREVVRLVSQENKFDSARLWLESLPPWDGVERIDTFVPTYWKTENSEYTRAVGAFIWTALAGRTMSPGCQVDYMPVLISKEGQRKTSTVRAIAPNEAAFSSVSLDLKDADLARRLRGRLVCEVAEMRGMTTRDIESIKDLITRRWEKWTPKFVEHETEYGRRCVLIGTTNNFQFLDADEGNRRILPLEVGLCDSEAVERDRDQLWAEGYARWQKDGIAWQGLEGLAKGAVRGALVQDGWHGTVEAWCAMVEPDRRVTVDDVLGAALAIPAERRTAYHQKRVGGIMKRLGWAKRRQRIGGKHGERSYFFEHPDADAYLRRPVDGGDDDFSDLG